MAATPLTVSTVAQLALVREYVRSVGTAPNDISTASGARVWGAATAHGLSLLVIEQLQARAPELSLAELQDSLWVLPDGHELAATLLDTYLVAFPFCVPVFYGGKRGGKGMLFRFCCLSSHWSVFLSILFFLFATQIGS